MIQFLTPLDYFLWLLVFTLKLGILATILRRSLHISYPAFFSYIVFDTLRTVALFAASFSHGTHIYARAYWAGISIGYIFTAWVLYEICSQVAMREGPHHATLTALLFWSAILLAASELSPRFDTLATLRILDRSASFAVCGTFILLLFFSSISAVYWRDRIFGISFGLAFSSSLTLVRAAACVAFGPEFATATRRVPSIAYIGSLLIWFSYMRAPEYLSAGRRTSITASMNRMTDTLIAFKNKV